MDALNKIRTEDRDLTASRDEEFGADVSAKNILKHRRDLKNLKRKAEIHAGDGVRIKTIHFGKKYARGRPDYTEGKVVSIKGKKAGVRYQGGDEIYETYLSRLEKLDRREELDQDNVVATVSYQGRWYRKS